MANEEIQIRFGGDLSPLGVSLRTMNKVVKDAGAEAVKNFKSAFDGLGSIISGGALIAGIKSVLGHFDELKDRADNLSISTDFLQGMQHIASKDAVGGVETFNKAITELSVKLGDAKMGGEEAVKVFEKWGFSIKDIAESDTEQMFYKITDRIKSIPDPSERSAAAFELLGKAGKNLTGVMQNGAAAVKSMVDQVDKLDAEKIKQLAEAKDRIEDAKNTGTIWAGKTMGAWGNLWHGIGNLTTGDASGWNDFQDQLNERMRKPNSSGGMDTTEKTILAKRSEELLQSENKYRNALSQTGNEQDRMNQLVRTRHELQSGINALQGESVEKYDLMTKFAENEKNINELDAKVKKEADDKEKEAAEKRKQRLQEERDITRRILEDRVYMSDLRGANSNAQYGDLQEVANSGYNVFRHNQWEWQKGPNADEAQQVRYLDARAKRERIWGNISGAKADEAKSSSLLKDLQDRGIIAPDAALADLNKKMQEAVDKLAALNTQATGAGLKVIGPTD